MLACTIGDCNIDVFIRVVEAMENRKAMTSKCYTYMY